MTADKAGEARQGLMSTIAGKAKEVAGAVTNRDELVEEGQLQQADSKIRKQAAADDAVADIRSQEATAEVRDATREAVADKRDARGHAAQRERAVQADAAAQKAGAERDAAERERAGQRQAVAAADAKMTAGRDEAARLAAESSVIEHRTAEEQQRLANEADQAERRAARLRAGTTDGDPS